MKFNEYLHKREQEDLCFTAMAVEYDDQKLRLSVRFGD